MIDRRNAWAWLGTLVMFLGWPGQSPGQPAGSQEPDTTTSPRLGLDGTWYELDLDCPFCLHFEEHTISLADKASILDFADRLEVSVQDGSAGFFTRRGSTWLMAPAVLTRHRHPEDLVIIQYPRNNGELASDLYARVWVLTPMANGKILFGRRYLINAFAKDAFKQVDDGTQPDPSFLPLSSLVANLDDVRVYSLNDKRRIYQPSPQVRISLDGAACFIREDTTDADIARAYQEARRQAEQRKKRLELFRTLVRQGDEAYHAADYEDALNRYKAASAIMPEMAIVHADLGAVYQVQNRLMEAEAAYRLAIELDPTDADSRFNLAQVFEQQGKLEEAFEMYRQVLKLNPDDREAKERVVKLRRKLGGR